MPRMVRISPKVAIASPIHWPRPGPRLHRQLQRGQIEHQMGGPGAEDAEAQLGKDVGRSVRPGSSPARGRDEADRRVHMRAGNRAKHGDEDEQDRARRQRIAEQGDRVVPARQMLGHDARTDDAGEQEEGAETLRDNAAGERRLIGFRCGHVPRHSITQRM